MCQSKTSTPYESYIMNRKTFFFTLVSSVFLCDAQTKFNLITVLYNETNINRMHEYLVCLQYNLLNKSIHTVHVIYDTSKDDNKNTFLHLLKLKPAIKLTLTNHRPSYGECFALANTEYPKCKIILSNADIFFNDSLASLENYNFTNIFLTLTRWNILENGALEIFKQYDKNGVFSKSDSESSQDVWIFETPLKIFKCDDIALGLMQCDSIIAYRAIKSGLIVKNPCLSIQCCHLHLTEKKNYRKQPQPYKGQPTAIVPWEKL